MRVARLHTIFDLAAALFCFEVSKTVDNKEDVDG